ncbi:hypothetical protein [Enterococcus crotali]|nr:hypothetical protein [Enterococcus crotali]
MKIKIPHLLGALVLTIFVNIPLCSSIVYAESTDLLKMMMIPRGDA